MKVIKAVKLAMVGLTLVGMVGCAGPGSGLKRPDNLTLIDPATTPKEQWSDALVMMTDQMGIPGMMDAVPGSVMGSCGRCVNEVTERVGGTIGGIDMGVISGSLGAGLAFGVLNTPRGNLMLMTNQIAYWVPADIVDSPDEAVEWVRNNWREAWLKATNGTKKVGNDVVRGLPINHPSSYATLNDARLGNTRPFTAEAREQVVGNVKGNFYGPIFIAPHYGAEWDRGTLKLPTTSEMIDVYGKYLPDTAMIYYRGIPFRKGFEPAFIMHQGKRHYFIAKPAQ